MTCEVIVRSQAQLEIVELVDWYEDRDIGLGGYFLLCLDASIEQLSRYPTAPRVVRHEYRRFFIRKFPVAIYYIVRNDKIYLDAVEAIAKDPKSLYDKLDRGQ